VASPPGPSFLSTCYIITHHVQEIYRKSPYLCGIRRIVGPVLDRFMTHKYNTLYMATFDEEEVRDAGVNKQTGASEPET
jgi:hypothetical protein